MQVINISNADNIANNCKNRRRLQSKRCGLLMFPIISPIKKHKMLDDAELSLF